MTALAVLACVGPACSDAASATGGDLLGMGLVVLALAAMAVVVLGGLARYNG